MIIFSGIYICHILSILKKLLFDEHGVQLMMLPFFFKSGCLLAFFELGTLLINRTNSGILNFLLIILTI